MITPVLPPALRAIYEAVQAQPPVASNLAELRPRWETHVAAARQLPGVHVEAGGEGIWLGELSPGCRACQAGAWDCLFVTARCNLNCPFCYSPHGLSPDHSGSAFGAQPAEMAMNYGQASLAGLAFSGGEPFLEPDRLLRWVAAIKAQVPDAYTWVYTNGLLALPNVVQPLGQLGIDELRFNVAATGYLHPTVMRHMAAAVRALPRVTVEIPAIPAEAATLAAALPVWARLGVRHVNLHELLYEPDTNAAALPGPRLRVVLPDGHVTAVHPDSRALTLAVMQNVIADRLPLSVNDCSLQSKLRQVRGRRRSLAPLLLAPYEQLAGDEHYESCCAYQGETECVFFHPTELPAMQQRYPTHTFARLSRLAPLAIDEPPRWTAFTELRPPNRTAEHSTGEVC
jgi:pyruvate formate-lyase activating enzyme-like uncharacterized protein